jgi:TP901 family phage tail tape measure protein
MAESNIKLRVDARQAEASLRRVNSLVGKLGIALGGVDLARRFFKGFAEADRAAAAVSTLGVNAEKLNKQLLALSAEQGGIIGQTELLAASYDVASAGFNSASQATNVLRAASKGAVGGLSDLNTVANATTSVLNAYGLTSDKASKLVDGFIQTQNDGKIIVAQYAAQIGRVAPTAAAAGVGIEELNAAISAVTATGVPVESTFAGLRQVIASVIKPSSEASTKAKELGLEFSTAAIRTKGFGGFLADVIDKTGGSEAELAKLFGSVEALAALMPLVNDDLNKFNTSLDNQQNAFGVAGDAADKMGNTVGGQITKITNNFGNLARTLDTGLGPTIKEALGPINVILQNAVQLFTKIPPQLVTFTAKAVALTAAAVTLRKVMLLTFLAKLPRLLTVVNGKMVGLRLATIKLKTAMIGLKAALPFGAALIALDLLVGKLVEAQQEQKEFNDLVKAGGRAQVQAAIDAEFVERTKLEARAAGLNPQQRRKQGLDRKLEASDARLNKLQDRLDVLANAADAELALEEQLAAARDKDKGIGLTTLDTSEQAQLQSFLDSVNAKINAINDADIKGQEAGAKIVERIDAKGAKRIKRGESEIALLKAKLEGRGAEEALAQRIKEIEDSNLNDTQKGKLIAQARQLFNLKQQNVELAKQKQLANQIKTTIRDGIVDSIMDAVEGTKSLGESFSGILRQLSRQFLSLGIGNFQSKGGGGLLGLIPGLANGGPAAAGRPYVVGEEGPELFVPNRSGTVIPNGAMGGANVTVNVDASGSSVEGNADQASQLGKAIGIAVQQELVKQKRPGGLLAS